MARLLRRLVCTPAVHFLAIGGLLFALDTGWRTRTEAVPAEEPVLFTVAQVEQLRRDLAFQNGSRPSPRVLRAAVEAAIDDEVLYREALATGLDRENPMIRQRLVQIARFVADDPQQDEEALYQTALRLGLDRSDIVVRRQLAEFMRVAAEDLALEGEQAPSEQELEAYLQQHADEFAQPWRVQLTHVYLSEELRGAEAESEARRLLEEIRAGQLKPDDGTPLGDPFLLGDRLPWQTRDGLTQLMGDAFADAAVTIPPGIWSGPLHSAYGWHLVRVDAVRPRIRPALAEVRDRVLQAVLEERREWRLSETLKTLRAHYPVRIEDPALADDWARHG